MKCDTACQERQRQVHRASLMCLCYVKHARVSKHFQKTQKKRGIEGRHRGTWRNLSYLIYRMVSINVSDGRSAVSDAVARLQSMAGDGNDAVSAHTQVGLSECPHVIRFCHKKRMLEV